MIKETLNMLIESKTFVSTVLLGSLILLAIILVFFLVVLAFWVMLHLPIWLVWLLGFFGCATVIGYGVKG